MGYAAYKNKIQVTFILVSGKVVDATLKSSRREKRIYNSPIK